jgi:EmrB/QacA subfamily drug resistance transporter
MAEKRSTAFLGDTLSTPRIVTNPWMILVVLTLGFFMILLDTTIVNVAIPSIIDGLHASLDQILWILNAYILVYAVLLITAGRLGDMFGPKRMFITGLIIFTLSSTLCGLAQDPNQLIFFRVVQAVGGALLTPQSLSLITSIFPAEKRGAAFGIWGAMAGLAAVAGPTAGGFLTTTFSWRAIFYVNVPIGIVAVILAYLLMPEKIVYQKHELDVVGIGLVSLGLFAGIFGLIEGQRYNWGRISDVAPLNLGGLSAGLISIPSILLAGILLLVVFVLWESRQTEPVLPLSLFRDRNFSLANLVSGIVAFGMFGLFLPLMLFLQTALGLSAEEAGITVAPMALTSMFFAPLAGRLTDKVNGKYLLAAGLTVFAAGMLLVVRVASLDSTGLTFTLPLIVAGVGMGFMFAPMVTLAMRNIDPRQAGAASGFLNTVRQVGAAMGSAVVGAILQNQLANNMHSQAVSYSGQLPPAYRTPFIRGFAHSNGVQVGRGQTGFQLPANLPAGAAHTLETLGQTVFRHAYLLAMRPSMTIPVSVLLSGAVIALFMRTPSARARAAEAGAEESWSGSAVAVGE